MANPIIKIKSSTTAFPTAYDPISGTGLTFAELGARLSTGIYGFYIGTTGEPVRIGSEVADDNSLGTGSGSPYKIPTQRSVKSYVNSAITGINNSGAFTLSRNSTSALTVTANAITPVLFQGTEFSIGSLNLTYANGTFTNTTGSTLRLNVFYQILWSQTTFTTNANTIQRSNWIQTSTGNKYGFSTGLVNPIGNSVDPDLDCIISASCIITLANNESFQVYAKNHSSSATSIITGNSLIPNQGGTRIQIMNI
jgi:hypothetical protein